MMVDAIAWKYACVMPGGRSTVTMGMPAVTNTSQPSAGVGFTGAFAVFSGLGPICDIFDLQSGRLLSSKTATPRRHRPKRQFFIARLPAPFYPLWILEQLLRRC